MLPDLNYTSPTDLRSAFDGLRKGTAEKLIVGPPKTLPKGTEYRLASCVYVPEAGKQLRLITEVYVEKRDDGYRVHGYEWGMPWTEMFDKCPL
jgi:hypothetical protein